MINARGLPATFSLTDIASMLMDIVRRAVDGTVVPLFVDYSNQRVIVGGTTTVGNNSTVQIQVGDIEVTTAGKGIIIKDDGGSGKTCRMTLTYDSGTGNWTPTFTTVS